MSDQDVLDEARARKINSTHKFRAQKEGVECTLTNDEWVAKLRASGGCCNYCGDYVGVGNLVMEHRVSMAAGSTHTPDNVYAACWACDSVKSDHTRRSFMAKRISEIDWKFLPEEILDAVYAAVGWESLDAKVFWVEEKNKRKRYLEECRRNPIPYNPDRRSGAREGFNPRTGEPLRVRSDTEE